MAFDFPSSPTNGQVYTSGGASYVYNGYGWDVQATFDPANYVLKAGDTMTGNLTINKASPVITLSMTASGQIARLISFNGANARWLFELGDSSAESGSNAGSNVRFVSYSDAGAVLATPLTINRATGAATFGGNPLTVKTAATHAQLILDKGTEVSTVSVNGNTAGVVRWSLQPGDGGGNSDFSLMRFDNAGNWAGTAININRTSGLMNLSGPVNSGFAGTMTTPDPKQFIAGYGFSAASAIALNGYLTTVPSWKFLASGYMGRMFVAGAKLQIDLSSASGTANADMTASGAVFLLDPTGSSFNTSLWLTTANPNLTLNKTASGQTNSIFSRTNGNARWVIQPGDGATESGGNAGSDFTIHYYADNGTYLNKALTITRSTGLVTIASGLNVNNYVTAQTTYNSHQFNQTGDTFSMINNNLSATANAHCQYNRCANDACWTYAALNAAANAWGYYITGAGNSTQIGNHVITTGRGYQPGGGAWLDSSDIRIKNVLGKYEHGLDEILQLEPIRYTFKGNDTVDPPSHIGKGLEVPEHLVDVPVEVPYPNSSHYSSAKEAKEFIGLVAQDVEGVMPEMVTLREGMIDGKPVTDLRDLENSALIYALVNAVKTLAARIETLERRT